ncbi:GAF domain-containing protein [Leptolyngbya sp. FACHB-541]|uniref:hybrid sensor histidine kinase/response regulator n=1 Tax=Leptolyngbya sp. FACHB-541 TaxID=2692810 RepID=UPI0016857657|nr:GAF domain-containing protein [Leptolyngbya sp. FACHB-541]MBD1997280.1 GAF domain-containing protein [Leptolyngbya sp. FACHB-541]
MTPLIPQVRLLLVDDSPDDRLQVIHILRREFPGLQVEQVNDSDSLHQALMMDGFDIAITDYRLRWTDGISVLEKIKYRYPDCPVIMLTASGTEEVAVTALKAGLDDYLIKSPKHYSRLPNAVRLAINHARYAVEQRWQAQQEQLITRIAQHIRQSLDLETILSTTVVEVQRFLQSDRVCIIRLNPDWSRTLIVDATAKGTSSVAGVTFPSDPDFDERYAQFFHEGQPVVIDQIASANVTPQLRSDLQQMQVQAALAVPILQGNNLWGLLVAHHCSVPRQWKPVETSLLQHLATQLAIAIQQSELYQQVQRLNAQLEQQVEERTAQLQQAFQFEATLKRITDKVRDSLDEDYILQTAVEELAKAIGVNCCNAAVYDLEQGTSVIRCEYSTEDKYLQEKTIQMANFPQGYNQLLKGQYFQHCSTQPHPRRGRVAMFSCPILDDEGVMGDLWLIHHADYGFSEQDIRLVQQVANQCAIALRQSRLYQAAQTQVKELEKLNRLKDDFLSTVSHELRTPVTNMKMAIQMLQVARTDQQRQRYLEILRSECNRETALISDLLDLQRLETLSIPGTLDEPIDLIDWLPRIIEPFQNRTQEQQQHLEVDVSPDLPRLRVSRTHLERVLAELLNNACKYTQANGTIHFKAQAVLAASTAGSVVEFTISNTAEIVETELSHIFEKFYRIPNADPWGQGGTGLGLALVQKLVTHLGGTIAVTSTQGWTTFSVQLPCSR